MNLSLDDEALKPIISKAILDTITPEKREALIQGAVADLLKTGRGSLLQNAFEAALERAVYDIARVEIDRPEVHERVRRLIQEAVARAFDNPEAYNRMVEKLAYGIQRSILET